MSILVKNASNTADLQPPYPYSTWIGYWEGKSGIKLDANTKYNCPAGDCKNACYKKILMDAMYKRFPIIRIRCILYHYAVVATKELTTSLLMKTF